MNMCDNCGDAKDSNGLCSCPIGSKEVYSENAKLRKSIKAMAGILEAAEQYIKEDTNPAGPASKELIDKVRKAIDGVEAMLGTTTAGSFSWVDQKTGKIMLRMGDGSVREVNDKRSDSWKGCCGVCDWNKTPHDCPCHPKR